MNGRIGEWPGAVPPLVGRQDVLEVFDSAIAATSGGSFQFLALVGEPGAGKTRLLDDLHWADGNSIELLDHLVRHPPRGRVMIAGAYRPAQATPRLVGLVTRAAQRIPVGPFTEAEVADFLNPQRHGTKTSFPIIH